jgi:hypothetical protein
MNKQRSSTYPLPGSVLLPWGPNFTPGAQTSHLGTKLHLWGPNFTPGAQTSPLGPKRNPWGWTHVKNGLWHRPQAVGCFCYVCFAVYAAVVRRDARQKLEIGGNVAEDFVLSLLFYPCVAVQGPILWNPLFGRILHTIYIRCHGDSSANNSSTDNSSADNSSANNSPNTNLSANNLSTRQLAPWLG